MATADIKTPESASNVYLFKNGYGMIVKTFEFPPNKNDKKPLELLNPPSKPIHGTFWIQSVSNKTVIRSTRTKKTSQIVDKDCSTIEELLEANVEQDVQLLVTDESSGKVEWISGKIKSIKRTQLLASDDETCVEHGALPATGVSTSLYSVGVATRPSPISTSKTSVESGSLILFETTDNMLTAFLLSSVRSIRGSTLNKTYKHKIFKNCLSIDYQNESESNDRGLMKYLTFGITWAPSYSLVLLTSDDPKIKRLRLSSKAVILNDIENMIVDNLYCIVGFPNVSKFATVIDPIMSEADVSTFLSQLKQSEAINTRSRYNNPNVMSNAVVMQQQMIQPMTSSLANMGPHESQDDTNTEDLHLYEFQNVSLNKKERLMLPIFDIELPYKDVYHCKIEASHSSFMYYGQSEKKDYEEVWHSVEFQNVSDFVWTTAPIVITKGQLEQQFIGQDTLTYTLKGSPTFVNLTKALNVRVQLDENVINSSQKRFVFLGSKYQVDEIEGKLTIMNYKSEQVVVVINATMIGKMSKYSVEPSNDVVKVDDNVINQKHDIRWEVTLKPKQTMEIKYNRVYNKPV